MAKSYSSFYIFRFALIMVVIVATGLSLGFAILKPYQDANRRTEKIQYILKATGIPSDQAGASDLYMQHLISEMIVSPESGDPLSIYLPDGTFALGDKRAFDVDMKKLLAAQKAFAEGKTKENPGVPLFLMKNDTGDTLVIIPVRGRGLWGPVWGNIAVGSDHNTITGATFDHQAETPGLGAEINQPFFQETFAGKKLFDDEGNFTSVSVVKGGVASLPENKRVHSVDGISGGTITSNGVSEMLRDCLQHYEPYLKKVQ